MRLYLHPALPLTGRFPSSLRNASRATHGERPGSHAPQPSPAPRGRGGRGGALSPLPSCPGATRAGPRLPLRCDGPPGPPRVMPRTLRAAAPVRTLVQPPPIRDKVRSTQKVTHMARVPDTISPFNEKERKKKARMLQFLSLPTPPCGRH